jgi:uncharacterized protein YdeI (YjbR/CyaY-like superfamily)
VNVSPDLAEALDRDMEVRRHFDSLSYSKKQRLVLPIEEAKKAETRQRRLDKAVSELREGRI